MVKVVRKIRRLLAPLAILFFTSAVVASRYTALISDNAEFQKIQDRPVKIMPFGNSITSALHNYAGYRYWLWKMLEKGGYTPCIDFVGTMYGVDDYEGATPAYPDFDQDHEGHRGYESANLRDGLRFYLQENVPDIVLWHVGSNDIFYAEPRDSTRAHFAEMLGFFRDANPNVTVIMAAIIPSWRYGYLDSTSYRELNEIISWFAVDNDTPESPIAIIDSWNNFSFIDMSDGIHPQESGEKKMATRFYEALVPILNEMTAKPVEITPASGSFGKRQAWDLMLTIRCPTNLIYMESVNFTVNGTPYKSPNVVGGTLADSAGFTFRIPNIHGWDLGIGTHEIAVTVDLSSGALASDTATWTIIEDRAQ